MAVHGSGGARKLQHPASILPAGAVQCEPGDETAVAPLGRSSEATTPSELASTPAERGRYNAGGAGTCRYTLTTRRSSEAATPTERASHPRSSEATTRARAQLGRSSEATTPSLDSPRLGGAV